LIPTTTFSCKLKKQQKRKQPDDQREKDRIRKRIKRANETPDQKEKRQAQDRERKAKKSANQPPELRQQCRERHRTEMAKARSNEAHEQSSERQQRDRTAHAIAQARETPEQSAERRQRNLKSSKKAKTNIPPQQKAQQLAEQRAQRHAERHAERDAAVRRVHEQQASAYDLVRLAEHDVDAALQLADDATGFELWGQLSSQSMDELPKDILLQMGPVTDKQIAKCMRGYRKEVQCTDVCVLVCAACNVKSLEMNGESSELHQLHCFQLSEKQQKSYNDYDEDLRKHFNVYIHRDDETGRNVYYGLNPDLVEIGSDDGNVRVPLCTDCRDAVASKKLPKYCIVNGYDFGRYADLPALSMCEELLLSSITPICRIFKVTGGQRATVGHTVFLHNSARDWLYEPVAQQVLPRLTVHGLLEVAFVGKKEEWEKIIGARNSQQRLLVQTRYAHVTSVRADVLYLWIHRLRRINPFFLVNTPPMRIRERTAELNKQLEALPDELLEKAQIICDAAAIQSERALRSGVAASAEDTSIGSVFVAPRIAGSNVLPSNQFLQTVQNSITSKMQIIIINNYVLVSYTIYLF